MRIAVIMPNMCFPLFKKKKFFLISDILFLLRAYRGNFFIKDSVGDTHKSE